MILAGKDIDVQALAEPAGTVSKHVPTVPTQGQSISGVLLLLLLLFVLLLLLIMRRLL